MKYRKLRIAFSVTCGIACVLLVVLWVRSYWNHEAVWFTRTGNIATGVASQSGTLVIEQLHLTAGLSPPGWHYKNYGVSSSNPGWFKWKSTTDYWLVSIPIWFLSVASIVCGTIPWLHWHFSLRTLLIATTVIGLILGLIIATTR